MSDDGPPVREAGTAAAIVRPDADEMLERERGAPKLEPAGECIVCRGQLEPDMVPVTGTRFGQPLRQQDGWYCVRCGLRYHHLPSRPPSIADDDLLH